MRVVQRMVPYLLYHSTTLHLQVPGLAQIVAFRKSAAAYDERVALQGRREFYARIPSLGAGPVDAAISLGRGGLSVKRSAGGLFGSSDSFHILGSFEAEPVVEGVQ